MQWKTTCVRWLNWGVGFRFPNHVLQVEKYLFSLLFFLGFRKQNIWFFLLVAPPIIEGCPNFALSYLLNGGPTVRLGVSATLSSLLYNSTGFLTEKFPDTNDQRDWTSRLNWGRNTTQMFREKTCLLLMGWILLQAKNWIWYWRDDSAAKNLWFVG